MTIMCAGKNRFKVFTATQDYIFLRSSHLFKITQAKCNKAVQFNIEQP